MSTNPENSNPKSAAESLAGAEAKASPPCPLDVSVTCVPWDAVAADYQRIMEFRASAAGDQAWAEIASLYRKINDLINNLPSEERRFFFETRFQHLADEI